MPLRLLFFGTPTFAVPSLEILAASSHEVVAVVTQPDRPRGRGHKVVAGAVADAARTRGLPVLQPEKLKDPSFLDVLRAFAPDLGVVAAYGKILPADLLAMPRLGLLNVHASLLPRWRGAAPVHRAILAGDQVTGVTIMRVVQALDAGPMLDRVSVEIGPDETSGELEARLASAGARLLGRTIDRVAASMTDPAQEIVEVPQDESQVTYAARLERADSDIDWRRPAPAIHNQIRGLQPWPLAAAMLRDRRVLLRQSQVATLEPHSAPPGTIVAVEPDALVVAAGPGLVRVLRLQLEGRAPVDVRAFLSGHAVAAGDRFEPLRGSDR